MIHHFHVPSQDLEAIMVQGWALAICEAGSAGWGWHLPLGPTGALYRFVYQAFECKKALGALRFVIHEHKARVHCRVNSARTSSNHYRRMTLRL